MLTVVADHKLEVADLCRRHRVRRLFLYGSAAHPDSNIAPNDLDFLVEFEPMPPAEHAECYFSLQESLESLFRLPVELVEPSPIRNPYLRAAIEATRIPLYEPA